MTFLYEKYKSSAPNRKVQICVYCRQWFFSDYQYQYKYEGDVWKK